MIEIYAYIYIYRERERERGRRYFFSIKVLHIKKTIKKYIKNKYYEREVEEDIFFSLMYYILKNY